MEKLIELPGLVVIGDVSLSRHVSCLACLVGLLVSWGVCREGMLCYGLITAVFGAVDVGMLGCVESRVRICGGGCGDDRVEGRVEGLWRRVDGLAHWVRRVG